MMSTEDATQDSNNSTIERFMLNLSDRVLYGFFTIYFLSLFMSVMPPFFSYFNRMKPMILGLSFIMFWILFICIMMAVGLAVLYQVEKIRGDLV
jgi:threonine/homoserine/homoserine lactone efflux protein